MKNKSRDITRIQSTKVLDNFKFLTYFNLFDKSEGGCNNSKIEGLTFKDCSQILVIICSAIYTKIYWAHELL